MDPEERIFTLTTKSKVKKKFSSIGEGIIFSMPVPLQYLSFDKCKYHALKRNVYVLDSCKYFVRRVLDLNQKQLIKVRFFLIHLNRNSQMLNVV